MSLTNYECWLEDESATQALGRALSASLQPGAKIWLHGEMGAGKSSLVRSTVQALGHVGAVPSPTYTLLEQYPIDDWFLVHMDLYRLADGAELAFLGLGDLPPSSVHFIEWAERAQDYLPAADLLIHLRYADSEAGMGRHAKFEAISAVGDEIVTALVTNARGEKPS